MKTLLSSMMLVFIPVLGMGQKASEYDLGKWYAGAVYEMYDIELKSLNGAASTGSGFGATVGYHLSSHFNMQLNLIAARQYEGYSTYYKDGRSLNRVYINTALYAPLTLRYMPFGSRRKWQPYLATGLNTLAGSVVGGVSDSQFWASKTEKTTKMMFNWRLGAGVRVRVARRVHFELGAESIGGFRSRRSLGVGTHFGLNYDFKSK